MTKHNIKTEEDIIEAFEGESRAKWTYKAFAERAEQEGSHEIARLFRAAATSEEIHANSLLRAFQEMSTASSELWMAGMYDPKMIKSSTRENLQEAIKENSELSMLYPRMIRDAEQDGWSYAKECFTYADAVDKIYDNLFRKALDDPASMSSADFFVCESCGNTVDQKPSGSCSVCNSPEHSFRMIS